MILGDRDIRPVHPQSRVWPGRINRQQDLRDSQRIEEPTNPVTDDIGERNKTKSPVSKKIPRFLLKVNSVLYARATAQQLFLLRMDIQKEKMQKYDEKAHRKYQHTKEVAQLRAERNQAEGSDRKSPDLEHNSRRSKGLFSKKHTDTDKMKSNPGFEARNTELVQERSEELDSDHQEPDRLSTILRELKESESKDLVNQPTNVLLLPLENSRHQKPEEKLNMSVNSEKYYPKRGLESLSEDMPSLQLPSSPRDHKPLRGDRRRSTGFVPMVPAQMIGYSKSGISLLPSSKPVDDETKNNAKQHNDEDDNQCQICYCRDSNSAFMPCGHGCVCDICAVEIFDKNGVCPICRMVVNFTHLDCGASARDQTLCQEHTESDHSLGGGICR